MGHSKGVGGKRGSKGGRGGSGVRTAIAGAPLGVESSLAVLVEGHLDPAATVGTIGKVTVGVERHEGNGLAVVVSHPVAWDTTAAKWHTHGIEPCDVATLDISCTVTNTCSLIDPAILNC